jgi:hypothetical protein
MQVSATLIAAQQAAREAQSRFQAAHVAPKQTQAASFASALDEGGFAPLPLKQTGAPQATASANAAPANGGTAFRLGSLLDIKI